MHLRTRNQKYLNNIEEIKKILKEKNKNKNIFFKIKNYFNNFELYNRSFLSKHKYLYAVLGGAGAILFWRGVWHVADRLEENSVTYFGEKIGNIVSVMASDFGTLIIGAIIMIFTGLFVSEFVDDEIIISGIKKEKKSIDRTEEEIMKEEMKEEEMVKNLKEHVKHIEEELSIKHRESKKDK